MAKKCYYIFYALFFVISGIHSQGTCCCGTSKELIFPGFDFEFPPDPPYWSSIEYCVGPFGPWNVTKSCVDHVDPNHYNAGAGNPNGPSHFVDLFGGPVGGPYASGTIQYPITGLTAGYLYTLEFYYAKFNIPTPQNIKGNVKVGNGAWLDKSWSATNNGDVIWLKASYKFTAQASSTILEFNDATSTAPNWPSGMLIDDIHLYECPSDLEKPMVLNPPENIQVACDYDIPDAPKLLVSDNCDLNPMITFKEKIDVIDPCTKKITRDWVITDACGNKENAQQIIDVNDPDPPTFTKKPVHQYFTCDKDIAKEFNNWIKNHGGAIATDDCKITWNAIYSHFPSKTCDDVLVQFIVKDFCGNESSEFANFTVLDTIAPKFITKAQSKFFFCNPHTRDSLRDWLDNYGYSMIASDCSAKQQSTNFNGDSTQNPLKVTFYSRDICGNADSCIATFSFRNTNDTFLITNYSCSIPANSSDTFVYKVNACDSIVIVQHLKNKSDTSYIEYNTCDPRQKIADTIRLTNALGCDSMVVNKYNYHPVSITNLQKADCKYASYSTDTIVLQGIYCDSLLITEYIPLQKDSSKIILNTCDKSKTDTTIITLTNHFGCDSIVTIFTVFTAQQRTFTIQKECGLSKDYIDTLKFASGLCDSLVITTHLSLPLDTTHLQTTTCDKTKAGLFSNAYPNQYGCDSLVINEIRLNKTDSIFISKSSCILSQAGMNTQSLKNIFGCDSIIQTTTTFIPADTTRIQQTSCDFTAAGIKTDLLKGSQCDSVIITTTLFVPSDTTKITQTSCDDAHVGLIKMILQNTNGCDSLVLIQTNYVPLHLLFNLDSITCFNQNNGIFRILNSSDFGSPFDVFINNNKIGSLNQISNLAAGSYEIYIRDKNGCITDSVQFTLNNPPALIIDLGNDLEVKKGTNINLNLQSNRTLQKIFWQPVNLVNCDNCNQINFTLDEDTWVYAQAIDDRNCIQLDSIFIRVKNSDKVFAPNSFSPNGDNINDYFYIYGPDYAIVEYLLIYDRWGEKVFETRNVPVNVPTAGWNGAFNGQKMNPGVFVYYTKVRIDDDVIELKGDLTLIR
jgi:gliding motility-associated-like protein